nr:MAG: hypothetical protein [Totiviridae sp.]
MAASSGGGPHTRSKHKDVFNVVNREAAGCSYSNCLADSDEDCDNASIASWASDRTSACGRITTTDTGGLRIICTCGEETEARALYLRRARKPRPLQKWRAQYPWVARIFAAITSSSEEEPHGSHETFRAAWAYTLAKAFQRAETTGTVFTGPTDPSFQVLLGARIEYTSVEIPFPIPSDLRACAWAFYGHQRNLRNHIGRLYRGQFPEANETLPAHVPRPVTPTAGFLAARRPPENDPPPKVVEEAVEAEFVPEPQPTGGVLDPAYSPSGSGGFLPNDPAPGDNDDAASERSTGSNLSVHAPVFSPSKAPPGYVPDAASLAGVRKIDDLGPTARRCASEGGSPTTSLRGAAALEDLRSTGAIPKKPQTDSRPAAAPAARAAPPSATTRPSEKVASWVAGAHASTSAPTLLPSMGPMRPLGERSPARDSGTQTPGKMERRPPMSRPTVRRARRSMAFREPPGGHDISAELKDPPRAISPEYSASFFDEGPVYEEAFRRVAGAVGEDEPDEVECNHGLFREAVHLKKIREPRRYCRHVRAGLARVMLRHPADWGIDRDTMQVLGAFVNSELLPKSLAKTGEQALPHLNYVDPPPARTLQECYTVEVHNRFSPLFVDDIDTIEADLADCEALTAEVARAAQRKGKGSHPSGAPGSAEVQRRKKKDQETRMSREQLQDIHKTKEQRKRNAKAALRRIAGRLAQSDVRDLDVAKTVVVGGFSPAVRKLVEENHHWLREPEEAFRRGKWFWAASCIDNNVEPFVATTGLFNFIRGLGDMCRATGSTGWVRDLCADGDIEENPGPGGVVNAPVGEVDMKLGSLYWSWIEDEAGKAADTLSTSVDYFQRVTNRPESYANDVNDAVLVLARWWRATANHAISFKADTWATTLYPSTLGDRAVRLVNHAALLLRDADGAFHLNSAPHTAVPTPPAVQAPSPSYDPRSPPSVATSAQDEASVPSNASSATPPNAAPPAGPSAEDLLAQHIHPDQPDVILASIDRFGSVLKVTSSRGRGVALPLQGAGAVPRLAHNDVRVMLVGRMRDGAGVGNLAYAPRFPITMTLEGEGQPEVSINGESVAYQDATHLRALKTDESPAITLASGARVFLIGEWYPAEGNATLGSLQHRTWGPPKFVFTAQTGVTGGSDLTPTATGTEEKHEAETRPIIVPRTEITKLGIDRTTAERLSLTPAPTSTTCEANALKLGLMLDWVKYGERDACFFQIFTGQTQVHEPRVRVARDTPVKRLFNASGFPREDCGGMVVPCFPFYQRWRRGRIRFFSTAQLVPRGEPYLIMPSCFDGQLSFVEAAVFLLTFLPWPWGNMSIAINTVVDGATQEREQIFCWYGTTMVVPGNLNLNVVLHQLNVGEYVSSKSADTELGLVPRMGPAPVEFWPGGAPIPVNCKAGQQFYVPAAAFAASWACGFGLRDIKAVISKIAAFGLFDKVERWILEGPCIARTHAGLMAVRRAKLAAEETVEIDPKRLPPPMFDIVTTPMDEPIPLMYRCWAASGNQMEHIPASAVWSDLRLPADGEITLPNLMSLSMVYGGFWKFENCMGETTLPVDHRLLSAAQFLTCERTFVGWHMWHTMIGLDTGTLGRAARAELPGRGESEYFDDLFGYGACEVVPPLGNLLRLALEKAIGGKMLRTVLGVCILQRLYPPRVWAPQVYNLTAVQGLDKVCPTPLVDIYVYKYLPEVPKAWQPFKVSYDGNFNTDIFTTDNVPQGFPPEGSASTYIWSDTNRFQDVDYDDIVNVRDHALWLNRLVHTFDEYELREFRGGAPVPGAPPPGYAPVCLVRGEDSWSGPTPRFWTETPPYPFFSTTWSSWMACDTHRVLTLQCELENSVVWYQIMNGPGGARSSGVVFDVVLQPSIAMPVRSTKSKRRLGQLITASENAGGGAATGATPQGQSNIDSTKKSEEPQANGAS